MMMHEIDMDTPIQIDTPNPSDRSEDSTIPSIENIRGETPLWLVVFKFAWGCLLVLFFASFCMGLIVYDVAVNNTTTVISSMVFPTLAAIIAFQFRLKNPSKSVRSRSSRPRRSA
jgi:hypothetical protein